MLKESARVVTVEEDALWVETRRKSSCQGCIAQTSCGHSLLDRMHPGRHSLIKLGRRGSRDPQAGDEVSLAVPDSLVLKLSLLFYLMPLAALLGGSLLAGLLGGGEAASVLGGLAGLGGGVLTARRIGRRLETLPDFQPEILPASPRPSLIRKSEF